MGEVYLGLDIGGTSVKMGIVDGEGHIMEKAEASVSFDGYRTPFSVSVPRAAEAFLAGRRVAGVGISCTGQVDSATGTVIGTNGKIPGLQGTCFAGIMRDTFGVPAAALNDATAAALGECFAGAGKGCRDVIMVTIGTGVGGGIVMGGRLIEGARGIAGEFGHMTLYAGGRQCPCGKRGCFEEYASTTALIRRAREATGRDIPDGRALFAAVQAGDGELKAVLNAWLDDIAQGLSGLVHIFNPERILIGGGVSAQHELVIEPLREMVCREVMPRFGEQLSIMPALLGNDAGMIGGVRFLMTK